MINIHSIFFEKGQFLHSRVHELIDFSRGKPPGPRSFSAHERLSHSTSHKAVAFCLLLDAFSSIPSTYFSSYPLHLAKVLLFLRLRAFLVSFDKCVHRGFPCSSCIDLCSLLSPKLRHTQSNYFQRCF